MWYDGVELKYLSKTHWDGVIDWSLDGAKDNIKVSQLLTMWINGVSFTNMLSTQA